MFTEDETKKKATVDTGVLVVMMHMLARLMDCRRLNGEPALLDFEIGTVGAARDQMVQAIEKATGKNFDEVRAQHLQAQAQAQQGASQAPATNNNKRK